MFRGAFSDGLVLFFRGLEAWILTITQHHFEGIFFGGRLVWGLVGSGKFCFIARVSIFQVCVWSLVVVLGVLFSSCFFRGDSGSFGFSPGRVVSMQDFSDSARGFLVWAIWVVIFAGGALLCFIVLAGV